MSNLRTRSENELMGGSTFEVLDIDFPKIPKEKTRVETPTVDETEQGVESSSELPPPRPESLAIAQIAANLVHSAWEQGYALGFNAGKNAGLDIALEIVNKPYKPAKPEPEFTRENPPF